jgi:hypothetical protein
MGFGMEELLAVSLAAMGFTFASLTATGVDGKEVQRKNLPFNYLRTAILQ